MEWPEDYTGWMQTSDEVIFEELESRFWDIHSTNYLLMQVAETNLDQTMNTDYQGLCSSYEEMAWMTGGAEMDHLEEYEHDSSANIYHFLAPAMSLVALYIFVEKGLKDICWWYQELQSSRKFLPRSAEIPEGIRFKVKKRRDESQIDANLRFLVDKIGIDFNLRSEIGELLELTRRVRNNFAHGDWAAVRDGLNTVDLNTGFELVALLFMDLSGACGRRQPPQNIS